MAQNSKIEWTEHTINLWWGCTKVHAGCDNCYAETLSKRWGNDVWGNDKPRKEIKSAWNNLLNMQNAAFKAGEKHRVFVGSMMDIFEKPMPVIDANIPEYNTGVLRDRLFDQISKWWYPNLVFLFLTKRPSNINKYIPESWKTNPPENVWFGTSPVDQETYNKLAPQLYEVKGKRFLSIEPQIGPIYDLSNLYVDWVIQGGESGHHRRPFDTDWTERVRFACALRKIPYFFKQIDKVQPIPEDLQVRKIPNL